MAAFWVVGGGGGGGGGLLASEISEQHTAYATDGIHRHEKRKYPYCPDDCCSDQEFSKRSQVDYGQAAIPASAHDAPLHHRYHHHDQHYRVTLPTSPGSVHTQNPPFVILREGTQVVEPQQPQLRRDAKSYLPPNQTVLVSTAPSMERTESGISISSDSSSYKGDVPIDADHGIVGPLLSDQDAADRVRKHVLKARADSQPARILRSLIQPRLSGSDSRAFALDNEALGSIFRAANQLFFAGRLSQRVVWDWSQSSTPSHHQSPQNDENMHLRAAESRYQHHVVGATAIRRSARLGGYETLIVLSSPILRDTRYNRRLLIATFLHEMIHSYLFVMCGFQAAHEGGHTDGFRQIADIIDDWVGREYLHLGDMEADLDRFRDQDGDLSVCGQSGSTCEGKGFQHVDNLRHHHYHHHPVGAYRDRHGGWDLYGHETFTPRMGNSIRYPL